MEIASFSKQMLEFWDGWTDGWMVDDGHDCYVPDGWIHIRAMLPQTYCRFPAQRWLTLLPVP